MQATQIIRHHPLAQCENCTLYGEPYVPSSIPEAQGVWAFIAEAPGHDEARDGIPLVDRQQGVVNAGKIFWHCMSQLSITRPDVFIGNVCGCRPPGNRKPTTQEIESCRPRLIAELQSVNPKQITLMGATPTLALLRTRMSIADARLHDHTITELPAAMCYVTYHPAALLHAGGGRFSADFTFDLEKQYGLFTSTTTHDPIALQMSVITDDKALDTVCARIEQGNSVIIDTETDSLDPIGGTLLCIQLGWGNNVAVVDGDYLHSGIYAVQRINEMLGQVRQCYHNAKFDVRFLREYGIMNAQCDDDTMLMSYSLDERQGVHSLKHLAKLHCNAPDYEQVLAQYLPTKHVSYAEIPKPILYKYAAQDIYYTGQVRDILWDKMDETTRKLYRRILMPASEALLVIEGNGMLYDTVYAEKLAVDLQRDIAAILKEIHGHTGPLFNPGSPKQVLEYLQAEGLPVWRSTDKEALDAIIEMHPVPQLVLDYREAAKSLSTYVEGWAKVVRADGRVHSTFMLHGTPTGRLASRQPNQQNMDRDGRIRNIIRAAPGYQLVEFDGSQHELRVMAYITQDNWLTQVFKDGRDIHGEVATRLFGPAWTKEQRVFAKMVVFGLGYGQEDYGLARKLKVPVYEAASWRKGFLDQIPDVQRWVKRIHEQVIRGEIIETPFGRRRRFGMITEESLNHTLKQAQNSPIQSTAHDMILLSLIDVTQGTEVDIDVAKPINEIHDALLFEVAEDHIDKQVPIIKQVMEYALNNCLPTRAPFEFKTEVKIGPSWGNMKEI